MRQKLDHRQAQEIIGRLRNMYKKGNAELLAGILSTKEKEIIEQRHGLGTKKKKLQERRYKQHKKIKDRSAKQQGAEKSKKILAALTKKLK